MTKCHYTREEHTEDQLVDNEEGGFKYCAECGDILEITDKDKYTRWLDRNFGLKR